MSYRFLKLFYYRFPLLHILRPILPRGSCDSHGESLNGDEDHASEKYGRIRHVPEVDAGEESDSRNEAVLDAEYYVAEIYGAVHVDGIIVQVNAGKDQYLCYTSEMTNRADKEEYRGSAHRYAELLLEEI